MKEGGKGEGKEREEGQRNERERKGEREGRTEGGRDKGGEGKREGSFTHSSLSDLTPFKQNLASIRLPSPSVFMFVCLFSGSPGRIACPALD